MLHGESVCAEPWVPLLLGEKLGEKLGAEPWVPLIGGETVGAEPWVPLVGGETVREGRFGSVFKRMSLQAHFLTLFELPTLISAILCLQIVSAMFIIAVLSSIVFCFGGWYNIVEGKYGRASPWATP